MLAEVRGGRGRRRIRRRGGAARFRSRSSPATRRAPAGARAVATCRASCSARRLLPIAGRPASDVQASVLQAAQEPVEFAEPGRQAGDRAVRRWAACSRRSSSSATACSSSRCLACSVVRRAARRSAARPRRAAPLPDAGARRSAPGSRRWRAAARAVGALSRTIRPYSRACPAAGTQPASSSTAPGPPTCSSWPSSRSASADGQVVDLAPGVVQREHRGEHGAVLLAVEVLDAQLLVGHERVRWRSSSRTAPEHRLLGLEVVRRHARQVAAGRWWCRAHAAASFAWVRGVVEELGP